MSIRGIGDAYAFRRLLWLLLGTVIVPTALLAVYGVYAIRNTRAAVVAQQTAIREAQLRGIAADLRDTIARLDDQVRAAVGGCAATACDVRAPGVAESWMWTVDDTLPISLAGIGLPTDPGPETIWLTPPNESAPIGVFRSGDRFAAWRLDMSVLQALVARVGAERHPSAGAFTLAPARVGPLPALDELIRRVQVEEDATLPLAAPLASWQLTLDPPPGATDQLGRTAVFYMFGLILLVATVITGSALVLGSILRELRLSRLQTDFVSNVSHELRTPLTSIRMFVETLQSGRLRDPAKVDEALALLAEETDRLSRRIERLLDWTRMEAGRRVYEVEDVPVADLVDEVVQTVRTHTLLQATDEEVRVHIPDDLPWLRVDRDAAVEALLNLVSNALRYTEPPRHVAIGAERRGRKVGISVSDNGPGIPRRDQRRIFEKFYQGEALLTRKVHGSGLGLAIVRAIAQGHGGHVELESEEGKGSTFTLWLPCA